MHINDILNSPLSKPKQEVAVKDLDVYMNAPYMNPPETPKVISIKFERSANSGDGSRSTYTLSGEFPFSTPAELREILDSIGYFGDQSLLTRLKLGIQKFLLGIIDLLRGLGGKKA